MATTKLFQRRMKTNILYAYSVKISRSTYITQQVYQVLPCGTPFLTKSPYNSMGRDNRSALKLLD